MKLLFVNPPSPYLENDAAYPPMGLLYLAASAIEEGHSCKICDLSGEGELNKCLEKSNYDIAFITCVTPNAMQVYNIICNLLSSHTCNKIVVGGPHVTFLPIDALHKFGVSIVIGEGDVIIKKIILDYSLTGKIDQIYYGGNVKVSDIPIPARHLIDLKRYCSGSETTIYTSRGCPYHCKFCSKITHNTYRRFPVDRVISEIEYCQSQGVNSFIFGDDNIIINKDHVRELLTKVSDLDITFRLNQDARHIDRSLFELAANSGCTDISFGIESGSQAMLDHMNKMTTVDLNKEAIFTAKDCGIATKAYFLVNFPGETLETISDTIEFAEYTLPDKWLLSNFSPLPGCDVFNCPWEYGINWLSTNWDDYYLVGKEGRFSLSFTTNHLTGPTQMKQHDLLFKSLNEVLG